MLKDGASAIYGTDAIGGVINFITRTRLPGHRRRASTSPTTDEGGAGKQTATLSAGYGDLADDRFNVFGVLDYQQLDALRSSQRDFIQERPLAERLPALMSSNTYPANVDLLNAAQRNCADHGRAAAGGHDQQPLQPERAHRLQPARHDRRGPRARRPQRLQLRLHARHRDLPGVHAPRASSAAPPCRSPTSTSAYFEGLYAETVSDYVLSPVPQRIRNLPVSILPEPYRTALSDPALPHDVERHPPAHDRGRQPHQRGDQRGHAPGARPRRPARRVGLRHRRESAPRTPRWTSYTNGYVLYDEFVAGIARRHHQPVRHVLAGRPGPDPQHRVRDEARQSEGTTTSFDASVTRSLMKLGGGDLGLALGAEYRKEEQEFKPSALLVSNNIAGDREQHGRQRQRRPSTPTATCSRPTPSSTRRSPARSSCSSRCATTTTATPATR